MRILKSGISEWYQHRWVAVASIAGLIFLVYLNTLHVPFQYDDSATIASNPSILLQQFNFSGVKKALTNNRPVSNLSFAINYYIGGYNVLGYHLVNLVVHSLTGFAVYLFFIRILGPSSAGFALLVALLWATHPVQTQAVTYITQRMASLAAMFFMWSVVLYIAVRSWSGQKRIYAYGASLLFALLAVGSKEMAVTLPVIIILLEYYFISRFNAHVFIQNWKYWAPFLLAVSAIVAAYAWLFVLGGSLSIDHLKDLFTRKYIYEEYAPFMRFLTEVRVVFYYISLLILPLPSRLNIYHDFPVSTSLFMPITTFICLMTILAMIVYSVKVAKSHPIISFGILWFLITLSIESFVFPLDLIFEHRLYLPSIGFFLIISWSFEKVMQTSVITASRRLSAGLVGLGVVALGFNCVWTIQRNTVWQNEMSLWADAVSKSPNHPHTHNGLGVAYLRAGQMGQAIQEFEKTVRLGPDNLLYRIHLNQAYEQVGRLDESIVLFEEAIRLDPASAGAYYYLGRIYYKQNKLELAEEALKKSVRLNPAWAPPYDLLGTVYQKQGHWIQAAPIYERLLQLIADRKFDPSSFERHQMSLPKMVPDKPVVHYQLAKVYEKLGRVDQAVTQYQEAIRDMPFLIPVRLDLARLYAERRKFDLAQDQYKAILEEDPTLVEVHFNMALVYELSGNLKDAAIHYENFLDLAPRDPIYASHRQVAEKWLTSLKMKGK